MELKFALLTLRRSWWLITLLAITFGGIGYTINQFQKPEYQAETTLLVTTGRPSREGVTSQNLITREQLAVTYRELLIKRPVLEAAAAQLGIDPVDLDKHVEVVLIKDTAILKLSVRVLDPQLAANLANATVQAFMLQEQTLLSNPYATDRSGLNVIEPAIPPRNPVSLGPIRNTLIGALIGVLIAMGITFAHEYFDTSIHSADDLTTLNMPILAVIAKLRGDRPTDKLVTLHKPESAHAEAYRMVRVQIEFALAQHPLRTLVVTSAQPSEGKSITAANLAIAMSQIGLRVILIDANLHRPVLHTLFQTPNTHGLTTAMEQLGKGRAIEHIVPIVNDHLSLLSSGPLSPNPAHLLDPEGIQALIAELQEHADLLIFDSPQCHDMIDTSRLLRSYDAALLVVMARATKAESILKTYQLLQTSQTHILGTVLNQATDLRHHHGYRFAKLPISSRPLFSKD